jgi:hypothetical protein
MNDGFDPSWTAERNSNLSISNAFQSPFQFPNFHRFLRVLLDKFENTSTTATKSVLAYRNRTLPFAHHEPGSSLVHPNLNPYTLKKPASGGFLCGPTSLFENAIYPAHSF